MASSVVNHKNRPLVEKKGYIDVPGGKIWYRAINHEMRNTPILMIKGVRE